jgi:hypothetical protein
MILVARMLLPCWNMPLQFDARWRSLYEVINDMIHQGARGRVLSLYTVINVMIREASY